MNDQFLLFQSFCAFLIASSVYGEPLPTSITSRYSYCYEFVEFLIFDLSTNSLRDSSDVDNLCMDLNGSTLHLLSSAQGGTTSIHTAPISEMIVTFLSQKELGIRLRLPFQPVVSFICEFQEPTHVEDIYNSIYRGRLLSRQEVTIDRFQEIRMESETSDQTASETVLSQQPELYTEFYDDDSIIFTFKEGSSNDGVGKAFLVFMPNRFSMSGILVNNNVVIRYNIAIQVYYVLTFRDKWKADHFRYTLRDYFNPFTLVSIPRGLRNVLRNTRV